MNNCIEICKKIILKWVNMPPPLGTYHKSPYYQNNRKEQVRACLRRLVLSYLQYLHVPNPPLFIKKFDDLVHIIEHQILLVPCRRLGPRCQPATSKPTALYPVACTRCRREFVDLLKEWYITYLAQNAIPTPPPLPTTPIKKRQA